MLLRAESALYPMCWILSKLSCLILFHLLIFCLYLYHFDFFFGAITLSNWERERYMFDPRHLFFPLFFSRNWSRCLLVVEIPLCLDILLSYSTLLLSISFHPVLVLPLGLHFSPSVRLP
ncbi:hypothetical protein L228DRAFT_119534 [Xylona heveae TC161]|uniref:Uncharacterized protein n=1 Tax=Xylona heveae (strain CBS 132557 / TC161) TaxID=1328760 RepID=A0A165HI23_XYLHT|nr:hypothetical protein L228DRAFT_119534 [Xylona heveae TC161]KZF23551.1 hypothetical protein L228DRAFT_119534 [Xylona heveae TC161]